LVVDKPQLSGCGGRFGGLGLAAIGLGVLAAETLDTASRIDQLLLPGEEGMAGGANFNVDVTFVRRTGLEGCAARALHPDFLVIWMYSLFGHVNKTFPASLQR
jgi:hypothetical protein